MAWNVWNDNPMGRTMRVRNPGASPNKPQAWAIRVAYLNSTRAPMLAKRLRASQAFRFPPTDDSMRKPAT